MTKINSILIANRGEIACRIIRTAKRLGIKTVAIYSDADANALHVQMADKAIALGGLETKESYLKADLIIQKAKNKVDAIHPGYGFLSENAEFAQNVKKAGLIFIGPSAKTMKAVGDKIAAKELAASVKVPTVPGIIFQKSDLKSLNQKVGQFAKKYGYPILIKASAGGGGRGMRLVNTASELDDALASASREAQAFFGNGRVFIEKYIKQPRHIEVQLLGDTSGEVFHVLDRDCSMQRRHQKVIEEAPAPALSEKTRLAILESAVKLAKAAKYQNAGTAEFLVDSNENYYFLEINSRLQVEHPVTEEITGLDLVEIQIRLAEGAKLKDLITSRPTLTSACGCAIECRICAEDPEHDFRPCTGKLEILNAPSGNGIRFETGVRSGDSITHYYDPMIAKLVVSGKDRYSALTNTISALRELTIVGVKTNIPYLIELLSTPEFIKVKHHTSFGSELELQSHNSSTIGAAWLIHSIVNRPASVYYSQLGFRVLDDNPITATVLVNEDTVKLCLKTKDGKVYHDESGCTYQVISYCQQSIELKVGEHICSYRALSTGSGTYLSANGRQFNVSLSFPHLKKHHEKANDNAFPSQVKAPLPGKIIAVKVAKGDTIAAGDILFVLESMKMEHAVRSPAAGKVAGVLVSQNNVVDSAAILAELEPID